MSIRVPLIVALIALPAPLTAAPPKPLVDGLKAAHSVAIGTDGRAYITVAGEPGKTGAGSVLVVADGKATPFATGLDHPTGLVAFQGFLFVADGDRVWKIGKDGKPAVYTSPGGVPHPYQLRQLTADENGILYAIADGGSEGGTVFRLDAKGQVSIVTPRATAAKAASALTIESVNSLLVATPEAGIASVRVSDGQATPFVKVPGTIAGLASDRFGRLYAADVAGKVWGWPRPSVEAVQLPGEFGKPSSLAVTADSKSLLVLDSSAGTLTSVPAVIPGWEVDDSPLNIATEVAFPGLKWSGWENVTPDGKVNPIRPIVLTHAGDGSNRVFVATQHGVVHVFPNDPKATETKVYLDIQDRVFYSDKENEQGLLGLAFSPEYKTNGELYIFYTKKDKKFVNVLSRFKVTKDADKADPASEEVLFSIERPYWNHDGGTLAFGPDGKLYVALGDGGAANDPFRNAQNPRTVLGKILRIDVSKKEGDRGYAIPADNPFVKDKDAKPEIYASGLRNVWRMSFDRKTGDLWAADVGQNLWEEINLITAGGNYGWNAREALHPFGTNAAATPAKAIDPIWEYHHDIGKSVTGGSVYRGKALPELDGHYLYADYVSSKMWALKYDAEKKRVVANRPIKDRSVPVMSFGEDEGGEVYFMTWTPTGQGVFKFVKSPAAR